jgi:hypothetical protein
MRKAHSLWLTIAILAPRGVEAIQDCHDSIAHLAKNSSAIAIGTIKAIGTRNMAPCPDVQPGMFYSEFRCGLLGTLDLSIERNLRGSTPKYVRVTLPGHVLAGMACDGPPTIKVGAKVGVFLMSDRDGYWVVSGVARVFDVVGIHDAWFEGEVEAADGVKRK